MSDMVIFQKKKTKFCEKCKIFNHFLFLIDRFSSSLFTLSTIFAKIGINHPKCRPCIIIIQLFFNYLFASINKIPDFSWKPKRIGFTCFVSMTYAISKLTCRLHQLPWLQNLKEWPNADVVRELFRFEIGVDHRTAFDIWARLYVRSILNHQFLTIRRHILRLYFASGHHIDYIHQKWKRFRRKRPLHISRCWNYQKLW